MTDKELIKQEIERRISQFEAKYPKDLGGYWNNEESAAYDCAEEYKRFLKFIDSLPEEPFDYTNINIIPKDFGELPQTIEQAAVQAHIELEEGNGLSFVNIFSKGAEWQKKIDGLKQEPASEDKSEKELAEAYLAVFDKKYPILPTLKGKQKADFKNFLNKCQQEFGLKEFGIHPTQSKLFGKLALLWAAWGAEHLGCLRESNKYEFDKEPISKDLEKVAISAWDNYVGLDLMHVEEVIAFANEIAEWQKEKDEQEGKVLFEKSSGDCPKELIDIIDKEFGIDGRDENDNPLNGFKDWQCGMILNGPAISKLVKLGVEWQRQMYAHVPLKDIHDAWQELKKNKPDIENYPAICFMKGADWRENQMKETLQTEYEKGRFDMQQEMMKDAVHAWVNTYESVTNPYDNEVSFITNLSPSKFKNKKTVKIIIVKEEQQ